MTEKCVGWVLARRWDRDQGHVPELIEVEYRQTEKMIYITGSFQVFDYRTRIAIAEGKRLIQPTPQDAVERARKAHERKIASIEANLSDALEYKARLEALANEHAKGWYEE